MDIRLGRRYLNFAHLRLCLYQTPISACLEPQILFKISGLIFFILLTLPSIDVPISSHQTSM